MTAPHFFAPDVAGDWVVLKGDEARHATRVLRIRPSETITVSDGRGEVVHASVVEAGEELVAEVRDRSSEPRPRPSLHVFHAIPKSGKLDLVVQKLTELGADVIQPFPAKRSVSRWDPRKAATQTERLSAIAREAAKQSRRAWLPDVRGPAPLEECALPDPSFVLDEEATTRFRGVLPSEAPETLGLIVGPEGGLAREEVSGLEARGAKAVSLGPAILRTETSALAASAVVLVLYERLG